MIELIIFDWDGVFTRGSTEAYIACYSAAARAVGVDVFAEDAASVVTSLWGRPFEEVLAAVLGPHADLLAEAAQAYDQHLFGGTFAGHISGIAGAPALVDRLAERYALSVATGMHGGLLRKSILPHLGIADRFDHVVSVYDVPDPSFAKPHPYMVQTLLDRHGVSPSAAIVVGDAASDVAMGRSASVAATVAVLTGHLDAVTAREAGADFVIDDVTHLEPVLEQLSVR